MGRPPDDVAIFWPDDTDFSNPANSRNPSGDVAADGKAFAQMLAAAVVANAASGDPQSYGQAVAQELFPDVLLTRSGHRRCSARTSVTAGHSPTTRRGDALARHWHGDPIRPHSCGG